MHPSAHLGSPQRMGKAPWVMCAETSQIPGLCCQSVGWSGPLGCGRCIPSQLLVELLSATPWVGLRARPGTQRRVHSSAQPRGDQRRTYWDSFSV